MASRIAERALNSVQNVAVAAKLFVAGKLACLGKVTMIMMASSEASLIRKGDIHDPVYVGTSSSGLCSFPISL